MAGGLKRRVRAEARLRFGGERAQIRDAAREVRRTYRSEVAVANDAAKGAKQAAKAAGPMAKRGLKEALAVATKEPTPGASAALGALGPAAARDAQGATRRLTETMANTKKELAERIVDAEAGRSSAIRQARSVRSDETRKLSSRLRELGAQSGTFKAARLGEMKDTRADRRITKRGQDVTRRNARDRLEADAKKHADNLDIKRGIDPVTGKKLPGKGDGPKPASNEQRHKASSQISKARAAITALEKENAARAKKGLKPYSRAELGQILVGGREGQTIKAKADGTPLPNPVKVPGIKAVDQLYASVALDLHFGKAISPANAKKLRALGFRPRKMGVGPVERTDREKRRAGNRAANRSPGSDRAQG